MSWTLSLNELLCVPIALTDPHSYQRARPWTGEGASRPGAGSSSSQVVMGAGEAAITQSHINSAEPTPEWASRAPTFSPCQGLCANDRLRSPAPRFKQTRPCCVSSQSPAETPWHYFSTRRMLTEHLPSARHCSRPGDTTGNRQAKAPGTRSLH